MRKTSSRHDSRARRGSGPVHHGCCALPFRCVGDRTLPPVLHCANSGGAGDAVGELGAGMNFVISQVLSATWSPTSSQRRGFLQPSQVLAGSAGDAAWGQCLPVTPKAITARHHSSQHFAPLLPLSFLLLPSLPLSKLLNPTSGADFYSNSSL